MTFFFSNKELGKIKVTGGKEDEKTVFYTFILHSDIEKGGKVVLDMGPRANKKMGCKK